MCGCQFSHRRSATLPPSSVPLLRVPSDVVILPPLPAPLHFVDEMIAGEQFKVATIPDERLPKPFFMLPRQHDGILTWIRHSRAAAGSILVPVGTVKSGKTTLLHKVLPGMVVAEHEKQGHSLQRPHFLKMRFPIANTADFAARAVRDHLSRTHLEVVGLPYALAPPAAGQNNIRLMVQDFITVVDALRARGVALWLLIDEFQAPLLADDASESRQLMVALKDVRAGARLGDCVCTGDVHTTGAAFLPRAPCS